MEFRQSSREQIEGFEDVPILPQEMMSFQALSWCLLDNTHEDFFLVLLLGERAIRGWWNSQEETQKDWEEVYEQAAPKPLRGNYP